MRFSEFGSVHVLAYYKGYHVELCSIVLLLTLFQSCVNVFEFSSAIVFAW